VQTDLIIGAEVPREKNNGLGRNLDGVGYSGAVRRISFPSAAGKIGQGFLPDLVCS
jgi:hypothetical protein